MALNADNLHCLDGFTVVFFGLDAGEQMRPVVQKRHAPGVVFVDMGMEFEDGSLSGMSRVATK